MARVFITGSADGLGRAAAETLLDDGHDVVVHVRGNDRLDAVHDLVARGAAVVVGDLSDLEQTRTVARDANTLGVMDAVIHNAGVYGGPHVLQVNVVAPYVLTTLVDRPQRLVYLSSGMHRSGHPNLSEADWSDRSGASYADSSSSRPSRLPSRACGPMSSPTLSTLAGCRREWADPARRTICASGT